MTTSSSTKKQARVRSGKGHPQRPVLLLAAAVAGGAMAVQARANGALAAHLGSAAGAALWSFGSGLLVLTCGLLLRPRSRGGLRQVVIALRAQHLRWWEVLGGLGGAFFIAVQSFAVPQTGVALFTIALVGGQTASSLMVDRLGLGPAGISPLSAGRVLAALATFGGVSVASMSRSSGADHGMALLAMALTILAGGAMAVQQAINGRLNVASKDVIATTFVNFAWGTLALGLWGGGLLASGRVGVPELGHVPWWSLAGGLIGVGYVAAMAALVRSLGVLVAALLSLAGQLVMAVVIDIVTGSAPVTGSLLLGVLTTLAAAAIAGLAARGSRVSE